MTTSTLAVSGISGNQFYVSRSELFFIAQKGDDLKTVKDKVQKCPVAQDLPLVQKGLSEEVIRNYNDLKSSFLSSGQWLAIPLIEEQIKMEEVMDLHLPGANLYKAIILGGKAAKIEKKLAPILAEVETKITEKASRKQKIEQLLERIKTQFTGEIKMTPEETREQIAADINSLGELKATEAFGFLVSLLESDSSLIDDYVKKQIIQALGQIGDKNCQGYLLKILQSPSRTSQDQYNKFNALLALENFDDQEVVKFLKQVATGKFHVDGDPSVLWDREAILSLASIYKKTNNSVVFWALCGLLDNESGAIRANTLEALSMIGDERSKKIIKSFGNRKDTPIVYKYLAEDYLADIKKGKYEPKRMIVK